ncbi:hypothetical protein CR513_25830, partial [Mucuna pruriens]
MHRVTSVEYPQSNSQVKAAKKASSYANSEEPRDNGSNNYLASYELTIAPHNPLRERPPIG